MEGDDHTAVRVSYVDYTAAPVGDGGRKEAHFSGEGRTVVLAAKWGHTVVPTDNDDRMNVQTLADTYCDMGVLPRMIINNISGMCHQSSTDPRTAYRSSI
jgi:hypothetical protein